MRERQWCLDSDGRVVKASDRVFDEVGKDGIAGWVRKQLGERFENDYAQAKNEAALIHLAADAFYKIRRHGSTLHRRGPCGVQIRIP